MRTLGTRSQRTLARSASVSGTGFITGSQVTLRFLPAAENRGIDFMRTDRPGSSPIPAAVSKVSGTSRRTTLGGDHGVTLVEHVLAALAGLRIDNCRVELDGPEPPGLDGSAAEFVAAIQAAGVTLQSAVRPIRTVTETVIVEENGATIALHPAEGLGLRASYLLDYGPQSPLPKQSTTISVTPESFLREVSTCRTFLLQSEVDSLRNQGIGRHLRASDLLVFGDRGPIDNTLRFADEPARHKLLDLIGDLALCGHDLAGHVVCYRSGHALNVALARTLGRMSAEEPDAPAVLPFRRLRRFAA